MPKVTDDIMLEMSNDDKILIKKIGYYKAARATGKSESYMRYMASKGTKLIRQMDLEKLKIVGRRTN